MVPQRPDQANQGYAQKRPPIIIRTYFFVYMDTQIAFPLLGGWSNIKNVSRSNFTAAWFNFFWKIRSKRLSKSQIKFEGRFVKMALIKTNREAQKHIKFYLRFLRFPPLSII
jgi:hypothetical protein